MTITSIELRNWGKGSRYYGHLEGGGGTWLSRCTTVLNNLSKPALLDYYAGTTATWWLNNLCQTNFTWDQLKPLRDGGRSAILAFARELGNGEEYAQHLAGCIEKFLASLKAPIQERDAAGDIGSQVHRAIHHYGQYAAAPDWLSQAQPEVQHAFGCWLRWWEGSGLVVKDLEYTVAHRDLGYAGTLDALCYDADGQLVLCDWKTSKDIYPDHLLQVAAYAHALADCGSPLPDRALVVHVPKNLEQRECRVASAWETPAQRKDLLDCWRHFARAMQLRPSKVDCR